MENLNIVQEVEGFGLEELSNLKINPSPSNDRDINMKEFNNFRKVGFTFNSLEYELGISYYSNVLFVIITSNGKLGFFWMGEVENKDDITVIDPSDNIYEVKCLLGNRKDEANQFLCNCLISYVFGEITANKDNLQGAGRFGKIQKILLSTTIMYNKIAQDNEVNSEDLVLKKEFKEFITLIKSKIAEMIF